MRITITSDFICPWCYIGEKRLAQALGSIPSDIEVELVWLPFELNPDMPSEGMDRRTYRSRKFGSWEYSRAMDAKTVLAGAADGAVFDYEAIARTPNTFEAHRLSWLARRKGKQRVFVEATLKGYFADGRDIGSRDVLAELASEVGLDRRLVRDFLASDEAVDRVRALEQGAYNRRVEGVPHFDIEGRIIAGAQSPEVIRQTILQVAGRSAPIVAP